MRLHSKGKRSSRLLSALIGLVVFFILIAFTVRSYTARKIILSEYLTSAGRNPANAGVTTSPHSSSRAPEPGLDQPAPLVSQHHDPVTDPGDHPTSSLFRPSLEASTSHYNFSLEIMPDEFLDHLQHLTRRIARSWHSKGWRSFDKINISTCPTLTPECLLFREVLPPNETALGEKAYRKCCVEHKRLAAVAMWTIDQLVEAGIPYFLSTGTALGAQRHGGTIIPWDTDVDLAIFPNSTELLKKTFEHNKLHYFHRDIHDKPMYWIHYSKNGRPADGPHVEIFADPVYTKYPSKLLPFEPCYFYGRRVQCPGKGMFSVWFPSGWQSYGGGHYHGDHRCTIYRKGKRIETEKC